ncbi:Hypothetical protein AJAP_42390 (plasmid) [Amycolatopsis japonica]|uniref:Uncharacterized protein n=1 Tax=Amycolatopsis japonica TaxID=208439 RepID=A0A075V9P2_9PSEU|nr:MULTISPECIES: hypothetical protein [Amycolatopsis]AIG81249.1 Hypothetical protein AJAP_42390 [Amycolatopsis japonica]RSN38563.1 hypothetical protein DMC64_41585 [Amycolatopsis sp. WAC 04197]
MERELAPGLLSATFARISAETGLRTRTALVPIADLIVKQARINASVGKHPYGTKTPAWPGTGPAQISGTLYRSIVRTAVLPSGLGWEVKVGIAAGQYPSYGSRRSKTPSSKYGMYLETGLRNGAKYPFLEPAFLWVVNGPARWIYDEMYGATGWLRLG